MIDFSKYNKGLHVFATLICDNVDIFNTDSFVDLYTDNDEYFLFKNSIFLLYKRDLYDNYILNLIRNSSNFLKEAIVTIGNRNYYLFIFNVPKDKLDLYERVKKTGSVMLTKNEIIETCILWRKYLDSSFMEMFNFWTCEQCLKTKG